MRANKSKLINQKINIMKKMSTVKRMYLLFVATVALSGLYSCHSGNQNMTNSENFLDLSARDTSVSPAQNFFEYANGTWLKNTEIPADQSGWGSFYIVREKALHQMRSIVDSCAALKNPKTGSPAQQIGDLYASAMDSSTIEKAGLTPLKIELSQIDSI